MDEEWVQLEDFPKYSVSTFGNIRRDTSGRHLAFYPNQYGVACVGLMRGRKQYNRSAARLVALTFIPQPSEEYDTPINLDGNRFNCHVDNLMWRPWWFAVMYNKQFKDPYEFPINKPIGDQKTEVVLPNSFACAQAYGLLERDVVLSILNRTYTWPTYQLFEIVE